mmetsp:Transcript_27326/g.65140  ORF Transcript_27326/g.65140 Transcript_27326/m.65140 type:complete len:254 (+) Transcript_27326:893-1654(+)
MTASLTGEESASDSSPVNVCPGAQREGVAHASICFSIFATCALSRAASSEAASRRASIWRRDSSKSEMRSLRVTIWPSRALLEDWSRSAISLSRACSRSDFSRASSKSCMRFCSILMSFSSAALSSRRIWVAASAASYAVPLPTAFLILASSSTVQAASSFIMSMIRRTSFTERWGCLRIACTIGRRSMSEIAGGPANSSLMVSSSGTGSWTPAQASRLLISCISFLCTSCALRSDLMSCSREETFFCMASSS